MLSSKNDYFKQRVTVSSHFAIHTNGIHGNGDGGALAWFAESSGVDGGDTMFILQALYQARGAVPCHSDVILVDPQPPVRVGLFAFNDVAGNGGAAIVLWRMPCQGHALVGDIKHLRSTWRTRDGCTGAD